jgi:hypothetical protein
MKIEASSSVGAGLCACTNTAGTEARRHHFLSRPMDDRSHMSPARFRALLDAYGADPDRWPPEERDAARTLLAQSPEARRWRDASAQLDAVLDRAPAPAASPELIERILATANSHMPSRTRRRATPRSRVWRYVGAALPLAAAAALIVWLLTEPSRTPERTNVTIAELGTYAAPTDVLLDTPSVDALDSVPAFGCTGSGLGCLDPELLNNQSALDSERYV